MSVVVGTAAHAEGFSRKLGDASVESRLLSLQQSGPDVAVELGFAVAEALQKQATSVFGHYFPVSENALDRTECGESFCSVDFDGLHHSVAIFCLGAQVRVVAHCSDWHCT